MAKSNTLEKLLFITTPFNSSMENKTIGSTSFNGSFFKDELGWFEYEWVSSDVSNATEEKPMFDYDTSVRVVMLSVLLGLAISIKGKLGKIFLLAQSFYLTLTKGRLRPPRSYLVNFGPFNLVFDQLWGFSVKIAY